jgi:hypothetical protein
MTSLLLVYFSLSERFLTGLSRKNAMYDELNVSCVDEVVPRQKEFKGGEDKNIDLMNTSFKDIPDYFIMERIRTNKAVRQCAYNVTFRCIRAKNVVVKSNKYYIF